MPGFAAHSSPWPAGCALALSLLACPGAAEPPSQTPAVRPAPAASDTEPEEINAFVACRQPARRKEILLDMTRRQLHQTVCGAALWFDGLFGARDLAAAQSSYGSVEVSTVYSQFEGYDTRLRFHARVRLPALQERLSAFIGLDDEDDFVRDRTEGQALRSQTRVSDRDQFLAGLGFVAVTTERFQSDLKVGVRNVRLPKIFVQNRLSYIPYSDKENRIYLRTTPFWNNRDRFGVTTSSDMDHALGEAFVLRWGNIGTVSEVSAGFDWRSAVILYQNLDGSSALAYEVFIRGATAAPEPLAEYGVRAIYREPFLQERLFGELLLGYSWPRTDPALEREGSAAIGLGVQMPFGEAPK
jgi:hypothetical protein